MNDPTPQATSLPLSVLRRAVAACDAYEAAWRAGNRPRLEDHLPAADADRPALLRKLLELELELRCAAGEVPSLADYRSRFPDCSVMVANVFAAVVGADADTVYLSGPEPTRDAPVAAGLFGDYELLDRLGRGGM